MGDLSDKVLETIKSKAIKPRPRWYFLMRDCLMWFLAGLATLLGGLAFSLVWLFVYFQNLGFTPPPPAGRMHWLFSSIPYAWLLVFLLLVALIYYNLKHLKRSYKYPVYLIILASLFGSIVLGFLMANFGVHRRMNEEFSRRVPFYGRVFDARIPAWDRPGDGVLAGKIKSITDDHFVLEDFKNQEWQIFYLDETIEEESLGLIPGKMVMITGHVNKHGTFFANEVFPWDGCRKKCKTGKPKLPRRPVNIQY